MAATFKVFDHVSLKRILENYVPSHLKICGCDMKALEVPGSSS